LVAARNQRASALLQSAERILKRVQNRLGRFETVADINGYFASDMMVEKCARPCRDALPWRPGEGPTTSRAASKTVKEDAVRQLKDRTELFR
jgi:hypothetical protein